ncbi:hypothetical protein D3C84_1216770 [compost metagenome]
MWVFVDLDLAWLAGAGFRFGSWSTATVLWIKQRDDVFQAIAVLSEQGAKFGLKLDLFFQAGIVFKGFQFGQLGGQLLFKLTEFCKA